MKYYLQIIFILCLYQSPSPGYAQGYEPYSIGETDTSGFDEVFGSSARAFQNNLENGIATPAATASYFKALVEGLVRLSPSLDEAEDFKIFVGSPRQTSPIYFTFSIVAPYEAFEAERQDYWVAFDVSVARDQEVRSGFGALMFVIDKSKLARRSFFGAEKRAPSPIRLRRQSYPSPAEIDTLDAIIAARLSEADIWALISSQEE